MDPNKKDKPQRDPGLIPNFDDSTVREQIKKKDYDVIKQTYEDLAREEDELKGFFKEMKTPTKEDPTLIRKQRYQEKMQAYKQVIEGLNIKTLIKEFWSFKPATPEETETLIECREYTQRNIFQFAAAGFALTTLCSYYYRRELPKSAKALGFFVGVVGGGIYGIIRSTEYSLRRFENLGPDYALGRIAISEIETYRMDKKTKKID
mmetsp:Transcript_10085/g.11467  ORF Transcript_10085/g.11467 Transcript_10085/m.11467 type:complete len:206 (-) Transcript_10085:16-633(-)